MQNNERIKLLRLIIKIDLPRLKLVNALPRLAGG